ncbi:transposase [Ensifer aridi]|nr:transposase [Ensifer aridi]
MGELAQAFGVAPSQLYAWRKQMAGGELDADQAMRPSRASMRAICTAA